MVRVIEKNLIRVGTEPMVILSLKKWSKIMEYFDEIEEKARFLKAFEEGQGQKGIGLDKLKKKYNL